MNQRFYKYFMTLDSHQLDARRTRLPKNQGVGSLTSGDPLAMVQMKNSFS
jgi:hypothetical protein